jgi:uracil phosphoribosyltransferase
MKHAKQICMTLLRDKNSSRPVFRQAAHRLAQILAHEAAEHLATAQTKVQTPVGTATGTQLTRPIVLVPILRSGITLLPAFLEFFTDATVGVVGLKRDETTAVAHWYYENFPPLKGNEQIIILDPMIATGGTGTEVLAHLAKRGVTQDRILFASIICAPEGLKVIRDQFPDITIITASIDDHLNATKFIVPGLGDFGDRYFGTE